jgi:AcrR family transcriptional regulator
MCANPNPGPGRPRDPDLERRALAATRLLYGEHGRKGVTFHGVALLAEVGKPALYRRWKNTDDMIVDALSELALPLVPEDVGDVTVELASVAESVMKVLLAPEGAAIIRVLTEFHSRPALYDRFNANLKADAVTATHDTILRAIERGDLPATTSAEIVAAAVAGGALIEVLTRLHAGQETDEAAIREFCARLARFAVAGARVG